MSTGMNLSARAVSARTIFGTALATVASAGVPVKLVTSGAVEKGNSNGFTVGTNNTITATFAGTRLCHIKARFKVDIAAGTDNVTLHIFVGGVSVVEGAARNITAASAIYMEIEAILNVANGEAIEIYAENQDTTENIDTLSQNEMAGLAMSHGFVNVIGA